MVKIIERLNYHANISERYNLIGIADRSRVDEAHQLHVLSLAELDGNMQHTKLVPIHSIALALRPKHRSCMVNLIDPSCFISESVKIGSDCVLYPYCFVGHQAIINDFVFCLSGCRINHIVSLGKVSTLASEVVMAGHVKFIKKHTLGQVCSIRGNLEIGGKSIIFTGALFGKILHMNL